MKCDPAVEIERLDQSLQKAKAESLAIWRQLQSRLRSRTFGATFADLERLWQADDRWATAKLKLYEHHPKEDYG